MGSSFGGTGYENGWKCEHFEQCGGSYGKSTHRWFCRPCQHDFCRECHPNYCPPQDTDLKGLKSLKIKSLKEKALAEGVDKQLLEEARDTDEPRKSITKLIV